jgi:hypothetical protein
MRTSKEKRKYKISKVKSSSEQRAQTCDIDHGPHPRATSRHGNSVDKALRIGLGMKEVHLTRDKKGSLLILGRLPPATIVLPATAIIDPVPPVLP